MAVTAFTGRLAYKAPLLGKLVNGATVGGVHGGKVHRFFAIFNALHPVYGLLG
jgi:hypothetical protein